jgi:hypothetical protein
MQKRVILCIFQVVHAWNENVIVISESSCIKCQGHIWKGQGEWNVKVTYERFCYKTVAWYLEKIMAIITH